MHKFEEYKNIAQRWCDKFFDSEDLTHSLRPELLLPTLDFRDFNVSEEAKKNEIRRLIGIRKAQLQKDNKSGKSLGKVLLLYPDRSLGDGLICDVTNGFFSDEDLPPWGTWFHFDKDSDEGESILYCWIPSNLMTLVDNALKVDFYDCLVWAD